MKKIILLLIYLFCFMAASSVAQESNIDESMTKRKKGARALWVQGGFGSATANINYWHHPTDFMHLELNGHFRQDHKLFSAGWEGQWTDCWGIDTFWGSYGRSAYGRWGEAAISGGIGLLRWYYQTESDRGTIYSPTVPALIIKAQGIAHLPQAVGCGLVLTLNVTWEATYFALSTVMSLGGWNW
jgi:hypothetical protein